MNAKLVAMSLVFGCVVVAGCATDGEDGNDEGDLVESPLVSGAVPANACLRVDASVVHSVLNVRSSPDIPEPDEAENLRATLPPTGPRAFMSVIGSQTVGHADATESGWWYRVRFTLENGNVGDGWVKGANLKKVTAAGGAEPAACAKLRQAPKVEVALATSELHGPRCLRVIEGDAQAQGLVLRSSPEVTGTNRLGAVGPRGLVRLLDWHTGETRDWYHVGTIDLADGKPKIGWVSGRGNFVDASNQCAAIPAVTAYLDTPYTGIYR